MYPRQSATTHTEQLGDEASVYDWATTQVHALNPTAAFVWRRCDGATSPAAIAAAAQHELNLPEAEAVVDLTLAHLARLHLLEQPAASSGEGPATTRRWLLGRGVAAAMLPAIASIVAPSPVEAQSPAAGVPTLTSVEPNQGIQGTAVAVRLNGTNFVVGATAVEVSADVPVEKVVVDSSTSLSASFVLDESVPPGLRTVRVRTAGGTSDPITFTITRPEPGAPAPTVTTVAPNQGVRGSTVAVTLTGTNFVVGATTVAVAGGGVTVTNVTVSSATSLTANFVIDPAAAEGPRTVSVATAGATSAAQTFTIALTAPRSMPFAFTGGVQTFTVPPGVTTLTVTARGAQGGSGLGPGDGGQGGSVTATLTVVPNAVMNVRVGGQGVNQRGPSGAGGFNGGGRGGGILLAGGGGGASDIRSGGDALSNRVIVAGGGGGGGTPGTGGAGGGATGGPGANSNPPSTVTGGSGGTQSGGGTGGINSTVPLSNGVTGSAGAGGAGGAGGPFGVLGGGGGGGGYFGGGGGAVDATGPSGAAGGGGSSFTAPGATGVMHTQGDRPGNGEVIITW